MSETLITAREAAKFLKKHINTLYQDIKAGRINKNSYRRISPRGLRFLKERMMKLFEQKKLYAYQIKE